MMIGALLQVLDVREKNARRKRRDFEVTEKRFVATKSEAIIHITGIALDAVPLLEDAVAFI